MQTGTGFQIAYAPRAVRCGSLGQRPEFDPGNPGIQATPPASHTAAAAPTNVARMTNSALRFAANTMPSMTAAQESEAWQALFKTADPATKKTMIDVAHTVVAGPTDNPKPFGAAALSAAVVQDKRDMLAEYFGLPRMAE